MEPMPQFILFKLQQLMEEGKTAEAAELMEQHRVTVLLVQGPDGRLAGAINSNDLMRAKVI